MGNQCFELRCLLLVSQYSSHRLSRRGSIGAQAASHWRRAQPSPTRHPAYLVEEVESEIVVNPAWVDALEGVEGFSHLWVIFQFSLSPSPETPRVHPQGRDDVPLVGIFATRSPVGNRLATTPSSCAGTSTVGP